VPVTTRSDPLLTDRTVLRPLVDQDAATLQAIRRTPEVARWWHAPEAGWPLTDYDEPTLTRFAVEIHGAADIGPDGALIGMAESYEGEDRDYQVANLDILLAASVHRRGLGREIVAEVTRWLVEDRGHQRVTVDPAVANTAAVACFRACGYQPVGVLHRYERDADGHGWHDNLLMEYLAP
jgi:aminoglycoside 6'-N-acetyltransferase